MKRTKEMQESLDKLTEDMFGKTAEGCCVTCKKSITEFRNNLSYKEFTISGMCQACQDSVFGMD